MGLYNCRSVQTIARGQLFTSQFAPGRCKGKAAGGCRDILSSPLCKADALAPHLSTISQTSNEKRVLLLKFPEKTTPKFTTWTTKYGVEHFIKTTGLPISVQVRRLPPDQLSSAKEESNRMEAMCIIRPSNSPWASPLHIVRKASGRLQEDGDPAEIIGV